MVRFILATVALLIGLQPLQAQAPSADGVSGSLLRSRAAEAVIWGMPAVNTMLMHEQMVRAGGKAGQMIYWGKPLDWHNQTLTPNPDTLYFMGFYDTKASGPMVVEIPPADENGSLNGNFVTLWQSSLEDAGLLGVDKGKGVKFVITPPGFAGPVPEGFEQLAADTFTGYFLVRSNLKSHGDVDVEKSIAYAKQVKFYPLSMLSDPPATVFLDVKDKDFDSTIRYDASFFTLLDRIVQSEPWLSRDRAMIDQLRSLGIERGKVFAPDAATTAALEAGIADARAILEARYDAGFPPFFEGTHWTIPSLPDAIEGQATAYANPDKYAVDARGLAYSYAYIAIKRLGVGQYYLINIKDADGESYHGAKTYHLHVPPDVPVEQYWSVTAYDRTTHALIKGVDRASRASNASDLQKNADGSVDIWFGPKAPEGREANWVPTDPARTFELMFRLYAPTKALFDKAWTLPDVVKVAAASPGSAQAASPTEAPPLIPYLAGAFNPAHAGLARSAGVPAKLANENYVKALAGIVYSWAYPAIDVTARTSMWELMKEGPGLMFGVGPGSPVNESGCIAGYLRATQRIVVTPNNDTFYGEAFLDLGREPVVLQTPAEVPSGHYWVMQITDVFTNVVRTLGSAWGTPAGKYLLVGPDWAGEKPEGFVDVIRLTTNYGGVFPRSFAVRTPEGAARAIAVQNQMGVYPLSKNETTRKTFDCEAYSRNRVFVGGVTPESLAADPDIARTQWVVPARFWTDLEHVLSMNPTVGPDDAAMAEQAKVLIALGKTDPAWQALLDQAVLEADADLHASAKYEQVGVDVGNGWQRQLNGGLWGTDWFGRAQAAVVYILVNDFHEAVYLIRATDAKGAMLDSKHSYTMTFPKDALPPVDRSRGGFWSLTMYDRDYFMMPNSPNGRTNLGSVSLDAKELNFNSDGSLTLTMSRLEPSDPIARANWLPAPEGQFALIIRAYVPEKAILDGSYKMPNVVRE